ncbi:MAG: hypothetical protein PWP73_150 [Methanococcus sp.]|jgi:hypothetical protein|nr:hypothetical protein [Methanococcus sp.]
MINRYMILKFLKQNLKTKIVLNTINKNDKSIYDFEIPKTKSKN